MGFVYQARQPDLDRMVALKILSPALRKDPAFEERFAREARVLGKLKHPNIVTLHEHGESGGYFYLMMEYIDGVNLRQAMSAGRFSPEQALAIVPSICDALQTAHAQGVWHRDIKPENILLDKDGRVKIADFGIARIVGDPERNFTLTRTGGQLGSAAYMAPEQHEKPHSVDHRADIYSLGVVIYEMLTGELPLGRFPLPSQRAEVGKRIDEIVLQTLEKERELRQQSAEEVKTDVRRATQPGATRSPAPRHSFKGQMRFFWFAVVLASAAILIRLQLGEPSITSVRSFPLAHAFLHMAVFFSVVCSIVVIHGQRPSKAVVIGGFLASMLVLMMLGIGRGAVDLAIGAAVLFALAAGGAVAIKYSGDRLESMESRRSVLMRSREQWQRNRGSHTSARSTQWSVLLSVCGVAVGGSGAWLLLVASPGESMSVMVVGTVFVVGGCVSAVFGTFGLLYLYMMKRSSRVSPPRSVGIRRVGAGAVIAIIASGVSFLIANGFTGRSEACFFASLPIVFALGVWAVRHNARPDRSGDPASAGGGKDFFYRVAGLGCASIIIIPGLLALAFIVAKPMYLTWKIRNANRTETTFPEIKPTAETPNPGGSPATIKSAEIKRPRLPWPPDKPEGPERHAVEIRECIRKMNQAANDSDLDKFLDCYVGQSRVNVEGGVRISPVETMSLMAGTIAGVRMSAPEFGNGDVVVVELQRYTGTNAFVKVELFGHTENGKWVSTCAEVEPSPYCAACRVEFQPKQGDARKVLKSHLKGNEFRPVAGVEGQFDILAFSTDPQMAKQRADEVARRLQESLKPFGMDAAYRIVTPAEVPTSPWPGEDFPSESTLPP
ncbi:MAG: serine/threonine protein kinase [Verrucomicrobia bacterium]|nr:serine/threonine protein kinase [Verrucomicrobiota bacterium]